MNGYNPVYITPPETGLVQSREDFLLPADAFPVLENAFVWRERIKRKQGYELLGRLRRSLTAQPLGNTDGGGSFSGNIFTILVLEATAELETTNIIVTVGASVFTQPATPNGTLSDGVGGTGTINYVTGNITLSTAPAATPITITFSYFPCLPVMGLCSRELNTTNNEQVVAFDTKYAYRISATGWVEFIPGITWSSTDSEFFWSTNYWVSAANRKLFWVTNFSISADPIRYTDGLTWTNFAPTVNAAGDTLQQCLGLIPFRSRLVAFNTVINGVEYRQQIRWAAIGSPLTADAWRDDIRGKGGFLNIPTAEDIIAFGFVRDNLVIYCERSTWQLRYTGRSIAPFQIEKVNTELGTESTFSAVSFDTSLVGIGDKGIVECDSFKSSRIDVKIPDFVFTINNKLNGTKRVYGIRDYIQKIAFWIYPEYNHRYPNKRLVYNYENASWAIFKDSLTCLGEYQPANSRTWAESHVTWASQNIPWVSNLALNFIVIGGNQQGYVFKLDQQTTNDVGLTITAILGQDPLATQITSKDHNLETGDVIKITDIPTGTPFDNLNDIKYGIVKVDDDNFQIFTFNTSTGLFDSPQLDSPATYVGGGQISVKDNFRILSKKFEHIQLGQSIQMGYIDVLLSDTAEGEISLKVYQDYRDNNPVNDSTNSSFNTVVPTSSSSYDIDFESKNWHRTFCPTRGNFIQFEWTLNDEQMNGISQESNVQIDAQILWERPAGRLNM